MGMGKTGRKGWDGGETREENRYWKEGTAPSWRERLSAFSRTDAESE